MKALTIRQPWASLIALGVKTIETRSWKTDYRGPLAIHAGAAHVHHGNFFMLARRAKTAGQLTFDQEQTIRYAEVPFGAVVATANLVDCLPISTYMTGDECVVNHLDGTMDHVIQPDDVSAAENYGPLIRDISDQIPYGDYAPGNFGWILEDIEPFDPVPAKGKQGLWEWDQ